MDPNQNPPSEREWTEEEKGKFYDSLLEGVPKQPPIKWSTSAWNGPLIELDPDDPFGDMKRLFSGGVASNASMPLLNEPITLESLTKMNDAFQAAYPVPTEFKDGADMSQATFDELGKSIKMVKPQGEAWLGMNTDIFIGIDIHIVNSIPFGAVEPCRCKDRERETK